MVVYPELAAEIARRGIKKKDIAKSLGICDKALNEKLRGQSPFKWQEVCVIRDRFFPDLALEFLFGEKPRPGDRKQTDTAGGGGTGAPLHHPVP